MRNYKITALCLCTIIGAGFATGKELMTYFVSFGIAGFFGILISSILFALVIHRIMLCPFNSLSELLSSYPCSKLLSAVVYLFLLVLYAAMLSASGEVLHKVFNLNKTVASVITALLTTLVIIKGYDSISSLSEVLFIPIVIIIFVISITATDKNIAIPSQTIITPRALLSPIIYVSYNILTAIPLLISIPNKYMYRNCGNQVGIVIFILASLIMMPLYTHYSNVYNSPLPLIMLLSGGIKYLYEVLLMLAVFSTAVSASYALSNSFKHFNFIIVVTFLNISALLISLLGFTDIINKIYMLFGIAGIILLILLFIPYPTEKSNNNF